MNYFNRPLGTRNLAFWPNYTTCVPTWSEQLVQWYGKDADFLTSNGDLIWECSIHPSLGMSTKMTKQARMTVCWVQLARTMWAFMKDQGHSAKFKSVIFCTWLPLAANIGNNWRKSCPILSIQSPPDLRYYGFKVRHVAWFKRSFSLANA